MFHRILLEPNGALHVEGFAHFQVWMPMDPSCCLAILQGINQHRSLRFEGGKVCTQGLVPVREISSFSSLKQDRKPVKVK